MMKTKLAKWGMLCATLLVLANCNDNNNSNQPSTNPPGQPGAAPNTVTISIPAGASTMTTDAFGENPRTISPGTTVTWVNNDSVAHTASSDTEIWDSGSIPPGGSFSHTFDSPGDFPYHCEIHPNMRGMIVVSGASPSPSPSSSPSPGISPSPSPTLTILAPNPVRE